MHSQNCSFLPSKKQPSFSGSLPHNIGMLRNFSSKAFSSTLPSVHISSPFENRKKQSRTDIMDIVCRFRDSSRIKLGRTVSNKTMIPTDKSRHSCKHLISNYNTVTHMPLFSSHLVGGFVGSKSQLGRRPSHGFGFSIWDIIRELVDAVGNSSDNTAKKGTIQKNSILNNKGCPSLVKVNSPDKYLNMDKNSSLNNLSRNVKLKDANNGQKQSYADVTKIKQNLPEIGLTSIEIASNIEDLDKCSKVCNSNPVLEHSSLCSEKDNRSRIVSECSIDSEDSFIVFEYCEGDDVSIDDDCSISDDGSVVGFQIIEGNEGSCCGSGECSTPKVTTDSKTEKKSTPKKVRFAEGKELVKVKHMCVWSYAHRMARIGQWEMLARDSIRFSYRITRLEQIISPILNPLHREAVFQQRFADLDLSDEDTE